MYNQMAVRARTIVGEFQKCGEIMTALQVDSKKVFALNCIFCEEPFVQLESFAAHMIKYHSKQLYEHDKLMSDKTVVANEKLIPDKKLKLLANEELIPDENHDEIIVDEFLTEEEVLEEDYDSYQEDIKPIASEAEIDETQLSELPEEILFEEEVIEEDEETLDPNFTTEELHASSCNEDENNIDEEMEMKAEINGPNDDKRNLTLAVIKGWEKHRLLWDKNQPTFEDYEKSIEAYQDIAYTVNVQMNLNMSWENIRDRIKNMLYRLRRNNNCQSSCQNVIKPLWYIDKLTFLNIEQNILSFSEDQMRHLIRIYKDFPSLWNVNDIGYRLSNKRREALDEMLRVVNKTFSKNLKQTDLQKRIYRINFACTQDKLQKIECVRKDQNFVPKSKFYTDFAFLEDSVEPFECKVCAEIFKTYDTFRVHVSKHDGTQPFICPACNKGFSGTSNFYTHIRRHVQDYLHSCKYCGKKFVTTTDLEIHQRIHTGEKPFCCDICGQSFRSGSLFREHMKRHRNVRSFKCNICSKGFVVKATLLEHMRTHNDVRDKVCDICNKAFKSTKHLVQHKQIHAEKKKYICKICNKRFAQCAGLSGHMKSHGIAKKGADLIKINEEES